MTPVFSTFERKPLMTRAEYDELYGPDIRARKKYTIRRKTGREWEAEKRKRMALVPAKPAPRKVS